LKSKGEKRNVPSFFPLVDGFEDDDVDESLYPVLHRPKIRLNEPFDLPLVISILWDKKLDDIFVVDISEKVNWYKYFIVATGRSGAHINSTASTLQVEAKKRISSEEFKIHQKGNKFWVIFTATNEFIVNLFTEEEREEYDLERVWTLRRNEKNPLSSDFDDVAETEWIYDEDDGNFDNWDPMDPSPQDWVNEAEIEGREGRRRKRRVWKQRSRQRRRRKR
jgi:ribosome-associated protein